MLVSKKWLHDYVPVADLDAQLIGDRLTTAGIEVEKISPLATKAPLVIGEVLTCEKHPNSDHLHVTRVNTGQEILQIVCGASNIAASQKVIVAKPNTQLPQIFIKSATVRGVESNGMICSLKECGVDEKTLTPQQLLGIEVLPNDAIVGESAMAYCGYDDDILDVKQTPNRHDFMAMWNVAKEVGAIFNRPVQWPNLDQSSIENLPTKLKINSTTTGCPLFIGKVVRQVTIKESPLWIKQRLVAVGIKTINNVVDISNFVMIETGQPLHFYDCAKLPALEITVSDQNHGEFTLLDENTIQIEPADLCITSDNQIIGLAGIMGGAGSKIDETTQSIVIEAAQFNAVTIRNTSRRLQYQTDAAQRFQKGIDPQAAQRAVDRAVLLLKEYADAQGFEETVVFGSVEPSIKTIQVSIDHVNQLLGSHFTEHQIMDVLVRLDCKPVLKQGVITTQIPSYRLDLHIAQDLIEEVARLMGHDSIEATLPQLPQTLGLLDPQQRMRRLVKTILTHLGLQEIITYTLIKETMLDGLIPCEEPSELMSPLSSDRQFVRNNLSNSILEVMAYNQAHHQTDFNCFEVSAVYGQKQAQWRCGIALYGKLAHNPWQNTAISADFYALKGLLWTLFDQLGFADGRLRLSKNTVDHTNLHPHRSAIYTFNQKVVAIFGQVHPLKAQSAHVKDCYIAEINLQPLLESTPSSIKFNSVVKYPPVYRDLAIVIDKKIEVETIISLIKKTGKPLVVSVAVFDVFESATLPENSKSVAFAIVYQSTTQTLTDDIISPLHQKICEVLQKECNAVLR